MAYRSTSSSTSNGGNSNLQGFSLPASAPGSRTAATTGSVGPGAIGSGSNNSNGNGNASSLLSAFNNPNGSSSVRGSLGGIGGGAVGAGTGGVGAASNGAAGVGAGLGGNSNQAQAAFMNAGPNRTVSNVGQQAAQGGLNPSGGAGAAAGIGGQYASGSPGLSNPSAADLNLDPSDFPALGGGQVSSSINSNSVLQTPGLLSSYATQAGSGGATSSNINNQAASFFSSTPGSNPANLSTGLPQPQREFSADDFPALGAPSDGQQGQNGGLVTNGQGQVAQAQQHAAQAQAQARSNQDQQASAAAALAHRQNLLGTMSAGQQNQARSVANAAASTLFHDEHANNQKKNYANKLSAQSQQQQQQQPNSSSSLSPYSANSPLPPSNAHTPSPHQSHGLLSNGIGQQTGLDGVSPSIAGRPLPPAAATSSSSMTTLPPQLSNMLLQQHLASQAQQRQHQAASSQQQSLQQGQQQGPPIPQTPAQQILYSPADQFGLLGLLNIIKMSADPDFGMLTLGTDLEKLGLDLGSTNNIHSNFITPWSDSDAVTNLNIEPEYQLPSCYNVQPPPASSKTSSFSDETLFFIFYSQPRDAMQEAAAEQLYKRNWRYHKDLHLWLTKDVGSDPTQKTATYERGSYIFFDPNTWEKVQKEFVLVFEHLETRHRGTGAAIQQQQQQQPAQNQQQPAYTGGAQGLAQ